jgi:hypothetical protein
MQRCYVVAAVALGLGLGGCVSEMPPVSGSTAVLAEDSPLNGATTDGRCVYRTVHVFDPDQGYLVDKQQRFCGGRAQQEFRGAVW